MADVYQPAIEALQQRLAEEEAAVAETKKLINKLCEVAGRQAPYANVDEAATPNITTIRPDTFYGKKLYTAVREYLEMRHAANLGPAGTRDIYDAIVSGGYQFEAADANNAMTGMRAMMRKNSSMFHRLPNNSWGLTAWYENIKAAKRSNDDDESDDGSSQDRSNGTIDDSNTEHDSKNHAEEQEDAGRNEAAGDH
jgi:hypothetical protein